MFSVARVSVSISDCDQAIDFYTNKLGCRLRMDFPYGEGMRWIEVLAPEGETIVVLHKPFMPEEDKPGTTKNILLETKDLDATSAALRERGVKFVVEPFQPEAGPRMAQIADPDGNTFWLTQYFPFEAGTAG